MSKTWVNSSSTRSQAQGSRGRGTSRDSARGQHSSARQRAVGVNTAEPAITRDTYRPRQDVPDQLTEQDELGRDHQSVQTSNSEENGQLQRQGAYYVQHPKPARNQKLKTMAQQEEDAYKQHRTEKRAKVAEMTRHLQPQVLGGSTTSAEDIRLKQEREQKMNTKFAGIRLKQKREEYAKEKQMREESELEQRKRKQREKAVCLEQKRQTTEESQREEMRRARLARFDSTQ